MTPEQKITRPERYRDVGGDIWATVPGTFGDDLVDESGCIRSYDHVLSQYGPLTLVHDDEAPDSSTPEPATTEFYADMQTDLHAGEEVFPGSIAAAEAALDGIPAASARWTKTVVVEEDGAWVLGTTADGRDFALRLPDGEHTELAEALLEETVDVAELRASCAAAEADYRRVVAWHHAMAVAIDQLGGDLPEGAPGMPEIVSDLVKIHGADKIRAALDSL